MVWECLRGLEMVSVGVSIVDLTTVMIGEEHMDLSTLFPAVLSVPSVALNLQVCRSPVPPFPELTSRGPAVLSLEVPSVPLP